jgi:hypothetical protein|tara:strand:+ start:204 stop:500 length:297 start_codon:yes stop_codon:yes gene_type:complete
MTISLMMEEGEHTSSNDVPLIAVEWMVEYILEVRGESPVRSITVVDATDLDMVRTELYRELTSIYPDASRIDVTVIRMATVASVEAESLFDEESAFQP